MYAMKIAEEEPIMEELELLKLPYESPELIVHGSLAELTKEALKPGFDTT
jgi:hypothetical protein